jgi:hypothetical protein
MRRPRGPGGRFLTAEEVAEMDRKAKLEGGGEDGGNKENANLQTPSRGGGLPGSQGSGPGSNKRKAADGPNSGTPSKRPKTIAGRGKSAPSTSPEDDEDVEDDDEADDG